MELAKENITLSESNKELKFQVDDANLKIAQYKERRKKNKDAKRAVGIKKPSSSSKLCVLLDYNGAHKVQIMSYVIPYLTLQESINISCVEKGLHNLLSEKHFWIANMANLICQFKKTKTSIMQEIKRISSEDIRFGHLRTKDPEIDKLIESYIIKKKRGGDYNKRGMKLARDFIDYYQIHQEEESKGMLDMLGGLFSIGKQKTPDENAPNRSIDTKLNISKTEPTTLNTSTDAQPLDANKKVSSKTYISNIVSETTLSESAIVDLLKASYSKYSKDPKNEYKPSKWREGIFTAFGQLYIALINSYNEIKDIEKLKDFLTKRVDNLKTKERAAMQEKEELNSLYNGNKKLLEQFAYSKREMETRCMSMDGEMIKLKNKLTVII